VKISREPTSILNEIQNSHEVLDELLEHWENLKEREEKRIGVRSIPNGYKHQCPRCEAKTRISGKHPYCSECNWDSLTDPSLGKVVQ
jgi:hypothetical protein